MANEPDKDLPQPGDLIGGRYKVLRVLGTGGMGVVLAARHLEHGHEVAIKMLLSTASREGESVGRFLREGKAASVLRSPHAVRLLDFGETEGGAPFLVMEFLQGRDLGVHLDERGPMPLGDVARLLVQACHALAEAHSRGIVHRDLKPGNLFLVEQDGQPPSLKILDFGISKFMGSDEVHTSLTGTQTTLGTPLYMSPEQVRNAKRVDTRTDVWSLGVLLQELLTGRPPFEAASFSGLCAAIIADPPLPIREVWPEVPPEIEALLARCLEKDPNRRLASVEEFAKVLEPHAGIHLAPAPRTSISHLSSDAPTVAAPEENSVPSTERAPSAPSVRVVSAGNTRSLAGVSSSRPSPPPRTKPVILAALLLVPLGAAATFWSRTPPLPAPTAATTTPPPPSSPPAAPASSPAAAPSAPATESSAPPAVSVSPSSTAPATPPAPPTTHRPPRPGPPKPAGQGYSPTNDDRK